MAGPPVEAVSMMWLRSLASSVNVSLFMRLFVSRVAAATPMIVADRVRRYHDCLWIMCKVSRVNGIGRNPPIAILGFDEDVCVVNLLKALRLKAASHWCDQSCNVCC